VHRPPPLRLGSEERTNRLRPGHFQSGRVRLDPAGLVEAAAVAAVRDGGDVDGAAAASSVGLLNSSMVMASSLSRQSIRVGIYYVQELLDAEPPVVVSVHLRLRLVPADVVTRPSLWGLERLRQAVVY
jgi:hypothetical protein